MGLLKNIDIFGKTFEFSTFNQPKYKTNLGGIMTLISLVIMLAFSFVFGKNFFYRLNPVIISQTVVPEKYPESMRINKTNNLVIAFRIEDPDGLPVNFEGIMYPMITYYYYSKNGGTELKNRKKELFPFSKCDNKNADSADFRKNVKQLDSWFCFDFPSGEYYLGGAWDSDELNYFELTINYCDKEAKYKQGAKCRDKEVLQDELYKKELYFSLLYPTYYFKPNNVTAPLSLDYKNYFYKLNLVMQKTDRFFFKEATVEDDQGWLLATPANKTLIGFSKQISDFNLFDLTQYSNEGTGTAFYTLVVYYDKNYEFYQRTYMKIQDLAAIMGGLVKMVLVFADLLSGFFNLHWRNEYLLNQLFDFSPVDTTVG
jgi:hypothetical protein